MKFSEKVRLLKETVGNKILFVQNGNFYIAIGKDAVLLNQIFELISCTLRAYVKLIIFMHLRNAFNFSLEGSHFFIINYGNLLKNTCKTDIVYK